MKRFSALGLALVLAVLPLIPPLDSQTINSDLNAPLQSPTATANGIQHVIWVWFENRDSTAITPQTAPFFTSFAATYANLTNFNGVSHPSQPNYLDAFSGSNQGILDDSYCTFPATTDNLAKQLTVAGKSWRFFAQDYPGNCSDLQTSADGVDGPGVAGTYVRKHNPAMGFESIRLDPVQCANIQHLANFDPTVNFAFVAPNLINDMHDGTTAQGDAFLQAFVPLVTASPDWEHTLLIVTFDEGSPGNHIYTAAGAPWLSQVTIATSLNHFNVLRTIEEVYGLPFLGGAATATTITELFPSSSTPTPTLAPTATPTSTPVSTPTPSSTSTPTPTPTETPAATPTPSPSIAPTPTPMPVGTPTVLGDISTRIQVGTGNNVLIAGFIVSGTQPKKIIVRAIGPSLPFSGALANPFLELRDSSGALIVSDDNWETGGQRQQIIDTMVPPNNPLESAIVETLPANGAAYTAVVSGVNNTTGVGLAELYDLDQTVDSKFANISTRGFVQTGNDVMIAGTIVLGSTPQHVLIRGLGPSLPFSGALADPDLELRDSSGTLIRSCDNWRDCGQAAEIIATGTPPTNDAEAAIVADLSTGAYTAIVSGVNSTTGVALVEIYALAN